MKPVNAALGVAAVGVGVLLMYAAYKNVNLFGDDGLVSRVLRGEKLGTAVGKAGKFADTPGKVGGFAEGDGEFQQNLSATESRGDFERPPGA